MNNIRIEVKSENYIVVIADTARFGWNEIMFEGNTFEQCFEYIKRETGKEKLNFVSCFAYGAYTDREGRTFPVYMEVME